MNAGLRTTAPAAPSVARPLQLVAAAGIAGIAVLYASYVLFVRAEPRPGLAAGSLLILAVAGLVIAGVRWAPLLAVPLGVAVVDRLGVYVPFSLERLEETGGLAFCLLCLLVVGVAATSGVVATTLAYRMSVPFPGVLTALGTSLLVAALLALLAPQAQADQGADLSTAQVATLPRVVMDDYNYAPAVLQAQAGTELALLLVNNDTETYRFVIDELDVDVVVPSGRQAVVRVLAPDPRTFAFYSSEEDGEHRDLGMEGTLVVNP